jgi:hypothetical protein
MMKTANLKRFSFKIYATFSKNPHSFNALWTFFKISMTDVYLKNIFFTWKSNNNENANGKN